MQSEQVDRESSLWIVERALRVVDVGQVVHGDIARGERRETKSSLYGRQNRGRGVLGVVDDEVTAKERRDHQQRNAGAGSPDVVRARSAALSRRGDVVPLPTELVIGDNDKCVLRASA